MENLIIIAVISVMGLSPLPNRPGLISHSDTRHGKFVHFTDGTKTVPDPDRTRILREKNDMQNNKTN